MNAALLIDFGSTYTKLRAVDLDRPAILAAGQAPSTVETDITRGMELALADLTSRLGQLPAFRYRLACSSAAGGLRMVTVGLVRELTAEAARKAALGAGARLVGTFAQHLTSADIADIEKLSPDILLLAGGTDGGNREVIVHNAGALANSLLTCPLVVAGNRVAGDDIAAIFDAAGKSAKICENVMPEFGQLNVEPARDAIREIFINRIVHAKGIDRASGMFDQVLMPTPAAVMEGARLLSEGHDGVPGLGELMVIDVGGATTDVHSVADGEPVKGGVIRRGLPDPRIMRTVEGDLGMRHNAGGIVSAAGLDAIAQRAGLTIEHTEKIVKTISGETAHLPSNDNERAVDHALARAAVAGAVRRHAGVTETVYTINGPATIQRGKDLSGVRAVIGTGGILAHGEPAVDVLRASLADDADPFSLRPIQPQLWLDKNYMLFAVGLLGRVAPQAAVALGMSQLEPIGEAGAYEPGSIAGG
ncbi:MAG TPA: methylaspartate mutase accessory protein GlmL [Gammaproteobacteria bacterium]